MLPNFFIAGVSRSGTTSLYHYMQQHPEIAFSSLKEPRFFSSYNLELPQKGPGDHTVDAKLITKWEEYEAIYRDLKAKWVGDASSEYLYNYESVIPETLNRLGDIHIILMLRNPVDRSYSAYNNLVRDGRETLSFEEGLAKEEERKGGGFDEMWHYKSVSTYEPAVKAFMNHFSKVKVLIFEEFIENREGAINDVFDFLGADPVVQLDTETAYSKSGTPKSRLVTALFGRNSSLGNTLRNTALAVLGRTNVEKIGKHLMSESDALPEGVRRNLNQYFADDVRALEELLGKDLSIWNQ